MVADKTAGEQRQGFKKGQSGNPSGRPKGARNKASVLAQSLLEDQTDAVVKMVIKSALNGDMVACKLILERLVPPAKERPVQANMKLPATITAENAADVFAAILRAVAKGELLPSEAETLQKMLSGYLTAFDYAELARRVEAIESKQGHRR